MILTKQGTHVRSQHSWLFFLGLNAPAFSIALVHVVNNPNLYHYALTRFVDLNLLEPNRLNTALGGLGILGLLVAALVQPTVGLMSDRTRTFLGARYPYFLAGAILSTIALLLIVEALSWWLLLSAVVIIQIAINSVQSPVQALIPDYVAPHRMGLASSMKTVLELLGIIASGLIVWLFLGDNTRAGLAVLVVSLIFFTTIMITMYIAPPQVNQQIKTKKRLRPSQRYMRLYQQMMPSALRRRIGLLQSDIHHITRQPGLKWWFASRFLFYSAFNTIGKFAISYLTDVYGYSGEEARAIQGIVLMATGIMIFAAVIGAGVLSKHYQQRHIAAFGGLLSAICTLVLLPTPSLNLAALMIGFIGMGCGVFLSSGWALVTNIVPQRFAAFYLGIVNLATTLGAALGLTGGYLVDKVNDYASNSVTGYQVLFSIMALFFLLGAGLILQVSTPPHE